MFSEEMIVASMFSEEMILASCDIKIAGIDA